MTAKTAKKSAKKKADYPLLTPPEFIPAEMPTATELATLAIPLIKGNKQDPNAYIGAVISARWLWDEAHRQLPKLRDTLYRRHAIAELSAELPSIVHKWPKNETGDNRIISYKEGITALFKPDVKSRRDGLMLELLTHMARDTPPEKKIGRANWRRLKAEGFSSSEFLGISYSLAEWRKQRKSQACSVNSKKRTVKKKKKIV
jgi:hypothetical protein